MKKLSHIVLFSFISAFFFSTTSLANIQPSIVEEKNGKEEWSYYMDHVVHLLDYVEAMAGLREIFDTEIRSNLDLFERKQHTLDFIAVTEDYLSFLEKYRNQVGEHKSSDAVFKKENEKIQTLALPSVDNVRSNLVLALQTKGLLDKMIADKSGWKYQKTQLVFKDNSIQKQYANLHEKLASLDRTVEESSLLTQKELAR